MILTGRQMYSLGDYDVNVTQVTDNISLMARLQPARKEDMPKSGQWQFEWQELWDRSDFEYQNIIKISCNGLLLGLIRYAVYVNQETDKPYLLEVLHLESIPKDERLVMPIGRWLIWYVIEVGLKYCIPDETGTLISLDSTEDAIPYYRDIIKMESLGWVSIAPGEDGYAFRFSITSARDFCNRQTRTYGNPNSVQT